MRFDELKHLYKDDLDFVEAWKTCIELLVMEKSKWIYHFIQDGMLLKGNQLCVPRNSMTENLIKEKHSRGLARHFGIDKIVVW